MRSQPYIESELKNLQLKRVLLVDYLKLKLEDEDWHGVEDAGSDLRDLDAKIETLQWVLGEKSEPVLQATSD